LRQLRPHVASTSASAFNLSQLIIDYEASFRVTLF
jgi:hypothetical protein